MQPRPESKRYTSPAVRHTATYALVHNKMYNGGVSHEDFGVIFEVSACGSDAVTYNARTGSGCPFSDGSALSTWAYRSPVLGNVFAGPCAPPGQPRRQGLTQAGDPARFGQQ